MDAYELSGMLFGHKRAESDASERLRDLTISGVAESDSAEGLVSISLDGDLTQAEDDGLEHDGSIVIPTEVGVYEGDEVAVTLTGADLSTLRVTGVVGDGDRVNARISGIEADYVKATELEADVADIGFLKADSAVITDIQADTAKVHNLTAQEISAATGYVADLQAGSVSAQDIVAGKATVGELVADHVSVSDFEVEQANIDSLQAATADIATIRANSAKVQNLTAAQLEADHATIGTLDTTYMHANMSNSDVAWISNGTIKDGAITNAMINSVSANKLTAGTIDASEITVTNLNADNITTGTINGQRIGEGSLSLDKLSEDVYTEAEVNNIVDGLNDRIDGAIETFTGTAVPTLNNSPASSWNTTKLRDEHVGDVYYVVNSQSQQNGYCYRFTKSGSTYSWQLIKDSDVTAALSRLTTAEGKITTFDSDISQLKTDTGTLTTKTTSLETRMSDAESDILDKVDTTTFNEVSDTVDQHSQTISQHTTAISNKADSSTVTAVTNRVSKNEQDISGINTTIGELQETVESKADGSTVSSISSKLNTVSDTVDGHTSQLSSITTTQTTMQSTLDKTVKSSIQLWYSKANTTAPSKPTSQVTSTSTNGNAWRIVVPAYSSSYPHYYYCWQYEYTDGTYGWSAVVRDIAMGESQSTARTADSNASAAVTTANTASTNASTALSTANTANTNASDAKTAATTASTTASEAKTTAETAASDASTAKTNAASAVTTANSANTTATNAQTTANANIKSSVQLWFTKANSTAPNKPTSVVSTSNANTANAWNLVVPVWNNGYPHYFYCYQQQKGDGMYQWTDVVYDRATSEAQQLANTTNTSLSTLQTNYATFKQQTEQFESTVGTTYATKTELKGATDDITELEGRVSTNETSISNNASAIALKADSSDVYTKSGVDGLISTEVTNRNAAITAKANEITSSVSQTYTTKEESKQAIDYVSNAESNYGFQYCKDIVIFGDSDKYYPVYFVNLTSQDVPHEVMIMRGYNEQAPDDWNTSTHKGALNLRISWNYGDWGGATYKAEITAYSQMYSTMLGDVLVGTDAGMFSIVFLRGGGTVGALYHVYSQVPFDRHAFMANAGVVGENDIPYVGLNQGTVYAKKGSYQWTVRAPLTTPNTAHIDKLYTVQRVVNAESAITQNANNIALKVSESDVTGNYLVGKINLNSTTASIAAQRINLQGAVTISDLSSDAQSATLNSNISVGGRNLLTNAQANWKTGNLGNGVYRTSGNQICPTNGSQGMDFKIQIEPNTPYVVRGWSELTDYPTLFVGVHQLDGNLTFLNDSSWRQITGTGYSFTSLSNAAYVRVTFKEQTYSASGAAAVVSAMGDSVRIKLEKGNKATDWSPAPEDVDSAISNAAKTATSYVTDITGGGIMVHPSGNQNTGVRVTSDVDILRSGTSVANYGTTARIGTLAGKHVSIDSDSVDLMDGNASLATFGANDTHIGMSGTGNVYMANDKFLLSAETTEGETVEVVSGLHAQNIGTNYHVYSGIESTLVYDDDGQQTTSTTVIEAKVDNGDGTALDWANIRIFVDPVNKTQIALTCEEIGLSAYDVWYQDPYNATAAALQLGKPVQRSASSNVSITSTNTWIDGPTVSLDAGYWMVVGVACFNTGSSSGSRKLRAQLRLGSSVYAEGTEVRAATNEYGRIQASAVMYVSSTSNATLVLSSSMNFTTATTSYITAVQLA